MYPETAEQCPICGCAKQENAETVAADTVQEEAAGTGTYTHVKGGRFSKANVRKRNKASVKAEQKAEEEAAAPEPRPVVAEDMDEQPKEKSNRGLVITVVVLLLAIVAVVIYIGLRFFAPADLFDFKKDKATEPSTTQPAAVSTQPKSDASCTGLMLGDVRVTLDSAGQTWLLDVTPVPSNTTDTITYTSSDVNVVTVSNDGVLTAVGGGEAVVTISCGKVSVDCTVTCTFNASPTTTPTGTTAPAATTAPTTPTETTAPVPTVDPNVEYTVLFYGESREDNDVTLATRDSVEVTLEDDEGNVADVTWKADDESIVEIDGSMFEAKSPGVAKVTTTYGTKTYTIIFRVY